MEVQCQPSVNRLTTWMSVMDCWPLPAQSCCFSSQFHWAISTSFSGSLSVSPSGPVWSISLIAPCCRTQTLSNLQKKKNVKNIATTGDIILTASVSEEQQWGECSWLKKECDSWLYCWEAACGIFLTQNINLHNKCKHVKWLSLARLWDPETK